ncbi:MAG: hypothetical protein AB9872_12905 [Solidesulfovibrio sp.]
MRSVKKIIAAAAVLTLVALAGGQDGGITASPTTNPPQTVPTPARADLAEAVLVMVIENAKASGNPLSQPVTLCEACVATHQGVATDTIRQRCEKACGLRY